MTTTTKKEIIKQIIARKYLNKDFGSFKADLLDFAKTFFPDVNQDFSENSFGGMMLDFAAYVGDVQSFYLDHQFHELDPTTAVELPNIERHLRASNVPIVGASPAVVTLAFVIKVPVDQTSSTIQPDLTALPIVESSTVCKAGNGTFFELVEDIDFSLVDSTTGELVAEIEIATRDSNNTPTSLYLTRTGLAVSGFRAIDTMSVGSFTPYMKHTISNENVTEIISVTDSQGNDYYEVEYLTQDTVYKAITNKNEDDNDLVQDALVLIPAPFRFVKNTSLGSRLTTLTFGGGSAESLDNDAIPDPSEFALPLYGKRTFSRFSIDPNKFLNTNTLGTVAPNSTITITYRHGGGLGHNVAARTIRDITSLNISFPNSPSASVAQAIRSTISVVNPNQAAGGDDPPTVDELKQNIPSARAAQSRIVSKPDVLARIYSMPANFGRVYRATMHPNPQNPLAARLYVISRNSSGQFITSPDTLKDNLVKFLNSYRLITEAIDVLDMSVINFKINFDIVVDPAYTANKNIVLQNVLKKLNTFFTKKKMEPDQPIIIADVHNLIFNNPGVLSVPNIRITNLFGNIGERSYSTVQYDLESNTDRGIIFGPKGSVFELRYPTSDIIGKIS